MFLALGILAGIALPFQTSINAKLREKLKSPYKTSFISFLVALVFLTILLIITGQSIAIPFMEIAQNPWWIWFGGILGVTFVTGNIVLFSKLGGIQTAVLPILGQILMGLVIDNFGLFNSEKTSITLIRVIGAIFVILGVVLISLSKEIKSAKINIEVKEIETAGIEEIERKPAYTMWLWRLFGMGIGMVSATQIGINGRLGTVVGSPIKGAMISFFIGTIALLLINLLLTLKNRNVQTAATTKEKYPWWIWIGGAFGGISVQLNVFLSGQIGTGLTVTLIVVGVTIGGLLVDTLGLFGAKKRPIHVLTIVGIIIMFLGAIAIKLL